MLFRIKMLVFSVLILFRIKMVQFCSVPGCTNRSDRETHLSFHRLPLKRKLVLKKWIHGIGRRNLPLRETTRVCSEHFENSGGRLLRWDEVPSLKLPLLPARVTESTSRTPLERFAKTAVTLEMRPWQAMQIVF